MPKTCSICTSDKALEVKALLLSGKTVRNIRDQTGFPLAVLSRHRAHIGLELAKTVEKVAVKTTQETLSEIEVDLAKAHSMAKSKGDLRAIASLARERIRIVVVRARLLGEFPEQRQNLNQHINQVVITEATAQRILERGRLTGLLKAEETHSNSGDPIFGRDADIA